MPGGARAVYRVWRVPSAAAYGFMRVYMARAVCSCTCVPIFRREIYILYTHRVRRLNVLFLA